MLLGSFVASFSYGLLVISAPESTDPHHDWDTATQTIHAGPDSLYVGVRDAASGLVCVKCMEGSEVEVKLFEVFAGRLDLPSARLKLYDPDEAIAMFVPVISTNVTVKLYVDDVDEPSQVLVQLVNAESA